MVGCYNQLWLKYMYLRNGKCAACNHQDIDACRRLLNMKKALESFKAWPRATLAS